MIGKPMLFCQIVVLSVMTIVSGSNADEDVFIIPDILTTSVGMYSVVDGSYLGDLIDDPVRLGEVHCVVQGPDDLIYVSQHLTNKILRYDLDGHFVDTFCDVTDDGLIAPKGIDFLIEGQSGGFSLLVVTFQHYIPGDPHIGEISKYSSSGVYDPTFLDQRPFVPQLFDIFVDDDESIWYMAFGNEADLSDGGVGYLTSEGVDLGIILPVRGGVQVNRSHETGNLLVAVLAGYYFGFPHYHEFLDDGTILASWNIPGGAQGIPAPHGIAQLENGMFLSVGDSGIWRTDPAHGYSATLIRSGTGFRMAHRATLPSACPADLSEDGVVNFADLVLLLAGWGTPQGDTNGDGLTDAADLLVLLAAWGSSC